MENEGQQVNTALKNLVLLLKSKDLEYLNNGIKSNSIYFKIGVLNSENKFYIPLPFTSIGTIECTKKYTFIHCFLPFNCVIEFNIYAIEEAKEIEFKKQSLNLKS